MRRLHRRIAHLFGLACRSDVQELAAIVAETTLLDVLERRRPEAMPVAGVTPSLGVPYPAIKGAQG